MPEDCNFALSVRGAESDVIKRNLEIVQRECPVFPFESIKSYMIDFRGSSTGN